MSTPEHKFLPKANAALRSIGKSRDGILVVGGVLYILGYIVWSVNAYLNKLGLLPAFESQYFIAGLVPLMIIAAVYYLILFAWTHHLRLPAWMNIWRTRKWWGEVVRILLGLLFVIIIYRRTWIDALGKYFSGRFNLIGWSLATLAALVLLLSIFSIDVSSGDPLNLRAGRTGSGLKDKLIITIRFIITAVFVMALGIGALVFYVGLLYSKLPQSLGGVRPRCAYLDVQKSGVSKTTLKEILPIENATRPEPVSQPANSSLATGSLITEPEITKSDRVDVLFSGSDYVLIRAHGQIYEIKKEVIHAVQSCD